MKLDAAITFLLLSSVMGKSGDDTDGEVTVIKTCNGKELEVKCEWEAEARRLLRGGRRLSWQRVLDMELDDVKCTLEFEDDEYETELEFPDDFTIEIREADEQDDHCCFIAKGIKFEGIPVTADLEIELKEIDGDAVYDDEKLSISGCPPQA